MRCFPLLVTVCFSVSCAFVLTACNPTFNWREVSSNETELTALLPCKPDRANRPVVLAGQRLDLHVMGCGAGGGTFAVSHARLTDAAKANEVLADWRLATLSNMKAVAPREAAFVPKGAATLTSSVQTVAVGRRADGLPVMAHAAWFARGDVVFSAVIYADRLSPEVAEAFFSGLSFQ
ncbi:MAG: hypothetical protein H7332_01895 [Bdellovibrionales bacterium]|nr:hypothetical protein [Ramlibacter sp.]